MMKRRINRLLSVIIVIMFTITGTVYAEPEQRQDIIPYGPKLTNLKGREEVLRILDQIKVVRASIININITEKTTEEELEEISTQLALTLQQFDGIENNLDRYESRYKGSYPDMLLAERLHLVINAFNISIISQQQLIKGLLDDRTNATKLFYSTYLIPVYYFLTLGDQVISYVETYIIIS